MKKRERLPSPIDELTRALEPGDPKRSPPPATDPLARRVVSRRSEGGLPYPGDFPNPLPGKYRGCF